MIPKENLLRVIRHDGPEWVPDGMESVVWIEPPIIDRPGCASCDPWGVGWNLEEGAEGGTFPAHDGHTIRDLASWRQQIRIPQVHGLDWSRPLAELAKVSTGANAPKQVEYRRRAQRMVTELWGNYGPLAYIWFDGGVLPVEKGGADLAPIQRRLQPHAVTFGGPAENPAGLSRWPGNEDGVTGYPNWSTVKRANDEGAADANGTVWEPGECDVPLRKQQWFWHPNQENSLRSLDELMDIYYKSVGRNANLIVNASINRDGLVPDADMKRFKEFGDEIRRRFAKPLAQTAGEGETVELVLGRSAKINHAIVMEKITEGERIREYVVEGFAGGTWKELCKGQSVGHKRIEKFGDVEVSKVRLRVTSSTAKPLIRQLAVYNITPRPK